MRKRVFNFRFVSTDERVKGKGREGKGETEKVQNKYLIGVGVENGRENENRKVLLTPSLSLKTLGDWVN